MLRAVTFELFGLDAKFWGVVAMGLSIVVLFFLPWIDRGNVKSIRYRSFAYKLNLALFVIAFFILGYTGVKAPTPTLNLLAQTSTIIYFGFFAALYFISKTEKTKPVPERVIFK